MGLIAPHPGAGAMPSLNAAAAGLKANFLPGHPPCDPGFAFDAPRPLRYPLTMPKKTEPRYDTCWRKSRIAARIFVEKPTALRRRLGTMWAVGR